MGKKAEYINFPVQLLQGFLINPNQVLTNILKFGIYAHSIEKLHKVNPTSITSSMNYFGVKPKIQIDQLFMNECEELYNSIPLRSPKTGLSMNILWDFYYNDKTEFEKACLLGFLAIKSIVQNKAFCKVTNLYWLSRMNGNSKTVGDVLELSDEVRKYSIRYQSDKLKIELQDNWGLKYYSRYTHGFYVSFELGLEELIYQVEKRRKSTIHKQRDFEKKVALDRVMERLKNEPI